MKTPHSQKLSAAQRRYWDSLTPEERAEEVARRGAGKKSCKGETIQHKCGVKDQGKSIFPMGARVELEQAIKAFWERRGGDPGGDEFNPIAPK